MFALGCSKTLPEGVGSMKLNANVAQQIDSKVDAEVAGDDFLVEIKATTSDFKIVKPYSELKDLLSLTATKYSLFIENFDENNALTMNSGRGAQRFTANQSFTINVGEYTEISATCKTANARVSVNIKDIFKKVFKSAEIRVYETSNPSRVLTFDITSRVDDELSFAYFNIDENPEIALEISAVTHEGTLKTISNKQIIEAQNWYKLNIGADTIYGDASVGILVDVSTVKVDIDVDIDPYK